MDRPQHHGVKRRPPVPYYTIVARALASARSRVWCQPQLIILDELIDALASDFRDTNPAFDISTFQAVSKYQHYRIPIHQHKTRTPPP
jgi:hypothetical protein